MEKALFILKQFHCRKVIYVVEEMSVRILGFERTCLNAILQIHFISVINIKLWVNLLLVFIYQIKKQY